MLWHIIMIRFYIVQTGPDFNSWVELVDVSSWIMALMVDVHIKYTKAFPMFALGDLSLGMWYNTLSAAWININHSFLPFRFYYRSKHIFKTFRELRLSWGLNHVRTHFVCVSVFQLLHCWSFIYVLGKIGHWIRCRGLSYVPNVFTLYCCYQNLKLIQLNLKENYQGLCPLGHCAPQNGIHPLILIIIMFKRSATGFWFWPNTPKPFM